MLLISMKPLQTTSLTSMSMVLKLSTRTRLKLKNGARNTMSCWPQIQLPSKSPNYWAMSSLNWTNSQSPWPKVRSSLKRSTRSSTPSSSSRRRPHASVLPLPMSNRVKKSSDKILPCPSISWSHSWRRDGKISELSTSRPQWENQLRFLVDPYLN